LHVFHIFAADPDKAYFMADYKKKVFSSSNKPSDKDFIFGTRAVMEAINSDKEMDTIYIQKDISNDLVKEPIRVLSPWFLPLAMLL
jgi:23S rRNA (guanosine2251-2'-O)-methyltransferase